MSDASTLKEKLYFLCTAFVDNRILTSQKAILETQASANEETKSSAGDKYETGRAMAQLEIEKHSSQIAVMNGQRKILSAINPALERKTVQSGSVVLTTQGNFYIAIAAGQLTVDGISYFAISPASPIALALNAHQKGDEITFNNKQYHIKEIM